MYCFLSNSLFTRDRDWSLEIVQLRSLAEKPLIEWSHHTFHHFYNIVWAPVQFEIQQLSPFCSAVFWSVRLQTTTFMIKIDCFHFQDQKCVFSKIISIIVFMNNVVRSLHFFCYCIFSVSFDVSVLCNFSRSHHNFSWFHRFSSLHQITSLHLRDDRRLKNWCFFRNKFEVTGQANRKGHIYRPPP